MPELSDVEIAQQLRQWADDLDANLPQSVRAEVLPASPASRSGHRRTAVLVAAVALVVLMVGVLAYERIGRSSETVTAANAGTTRVRHERMEYRQTADLSCQDRADPNTFDSATFETWGDNGHWRMTVTYPDGSTRDVITVGDRWYPTAVYTQGAVRGAAHGCGPGEGGILVAEPGQRDIHTVNPLAPIPNTPQPPGSPPFWTLPAVLTYQTLATQVPGEFQDSKGRTAQLWRQVINGNRDENLADTTTSEWYVEPSSGEVLEHSYTDTVEGIGTVSYTETVITDDDTTVATSIFDTKGLTQTQDYLASDGSSSSSSSSAVASESSASVDCSSVHESVVVTEADADTEVHVGRETSRFSVCLDAHAHPLANLRTTDCPFGYVSNLSVNGPDNYPIGFEVTTTGTCTVTNGDYQVRIVAP